MSATTPDDLRGRGAAPQPLHGAAPQPTPGGSRRRDRLSRAYLYLICGEVAPEPLEEALLGGVDLVQLRMKEAPDAAVRRTAHWMRRLCAEHDALFILNDRPDLAAELDTDGVHVGQHDIPAAEARRLVGADRILGLSTHSPGQIDAAGPAGVDYIGVGPVHATPTKPGRSPVGLELVAHAAAHTTLPFFAIGGIDPSSAPAVCRAGATRIAVVRAITEAPDPRRAAVALREIVSGEARVGAAQS